MIRQLVIATLASATLGTTAYAQCAYIPAKAVMSQPEYVLVFGGRVVDIQEISASASVPRARQALGGGDDTDV